MRRKYRAIWLSDVHLGTGASRARDLLAFLEDVSADVIHLAGEIVDVQRLKIRPTFPAAHRQVVDRFLELAREGMRMIYVPGNHDIEFRRLAAGNICGIEIELEARHQCADDRRLLVAHGDCIDPRIRNGGLAEQFGSAAYRWLVEADARVNQLRQRFGKDYSSFSTAVKLRLKSASDYIERFEETAARYASTRGFDGIVCGHIHRPRIREIEGVCYANDGDWMEHRTALAETTDGQLQLLRWTTVALTVEPAPQPVPVAA